MHLIFHGWITQHLSTLQRPLLLHFTGRGCLCHCCAILALFLKKSQLKGTSSLILKWRHLTEQILYSLRAESFPHRCILRTTLLHLHVETVFALGKHWGHKGATLFIQVGQLGIRADKYCPSLCADIEPMLVEDAELFLSTHTRSLSNEEAKLTKHVCCHTDSSFVAPMGCHGIEQSRSGISLEISLGVICHYLHNSMPNRIAHVISTDGYQFENRIDIPPQISSILFCKDGNLQHHFLPNTGIGHDQMCYQLIHNPLRIVSITNDKQQVQCPSPHTYISVLQRYQHRRLMLLRPLHAALNLGKLCHCHQPQVTDIWLADGYELAENSHCPLENLRWTGRSPCHNQIYGLEQDGMIGIGFVN